MAYVAPRSFRRRRSRGKHVRDVERLKVLGRIAEQEILRAELARLAARERHRHEERTQKEREVLRLGLRLDSVPDTRRDRVVAPVGRAHGDPESLTWAQTAP